MRKEVSRPMQGITAGESPFDSLQTRHIIERDLAPMRIVDGFNIIARPNLYDHVTDGTSVICINLASPKCRALCQQAGLGSLPCANTCPYSS